MSTTPSVAVAEAAALNLFHTLGYALLVLVHVYLPTSVNTCIAYMRLNVNISSNNTDMYILVLCLAILRISGIYRLKKILRYIEECVSERIEL